ncbi:hypothetical protein L218DRAFT_297804 [Marasmius fiardii PR-910]|nr:hypothetical protein L218DRAFT_297804 [Marasmius fiardii PR-910]
MHSLETCHIRYIEWPLPSGLLTMAERSSSSLKRVVLTSYLKIGSGLGEDPVLLNFLQAASELTHFELFFGRENVGDSLRYRTFRDGMVSTLLSKLTDDDDPSFLPKLESLTLKLPDITLNQRLVERVLEVVTTRRPTPHPLMQFRLIRRLPTVGAKSGEKFIVEPELLERIRFLEESQVEVVVGDDRRK